MAVKTYIWESNTYIARIKKASRKSVSLKKYRLYVEKRHAPSFYF